MGHSAEEDDPFEAQRENATSPMRRLFAEYGRRNPIAFVSGVAASIVARVLDLLPPLLLGIAVDAIFNDQKAFSLLFVPQSWLPTAESDQLLLLTALIAVSFFGGAAFHWNREVSFPLGYFMHLSII